MSTPGPVTDTPVVEQPAQINGQQGDKDHHPANDMFQDAPTPSKTVNHIYNYPMVHELCDRIMEWTLPRWGYVLTEAYAQKVVKPVVGVGLKLPGANIVTRVADTIDVYSNGLLDNVDIMFPITTKSTQHNWNDAKSTVEYVKDTFRSDLKKMGDTVPNRAKAAFTATIKCGSEAVVTLSDSIVKASARANQFVQDGTNKLRSNGKQALDDAKKMGQQFVDDAKKRLGQAQDEAQDMSKKVQETAQSTTEDGPAQTNGQTESAELNEDIAENAQHGDK